MNIKGETELSNWPSSLYGKKIDFAFAREWSPAADAALACIARERGVRRETNTHGTETRSKLEGGK